MPLSTISHAPGVTPPNPGTTLNEAVVPPSRSVSLGRPPLGVQPRRIWLEKRAHDLAAALEDHLAYAQQVGERPDTRTLLDWTSELGAILSELERKGGY